MAKKQIGEDYRAIGELARMFLAADEARQNRALDAANFPPAVTDSKADAERAAWIFFMLGRRSMEDGGLSLEAVKASLTNSVSSMLAHAAKGLTPGELAVAEACGLSPEQMAAGTLATAGQSAALTARPPHGLSAQDMEIARACGVSPEEMAAAKAAA